MSFQGKTVLITGSTDGVGRRVAERLGAAGAKVLVHGRNPARAESLLASLRASGAEARFYPADFSSLAQVRSLAEAIQRDCDRLDLLISNAGIGPGGPARQMSADGYELRFAVNYLAGFLLTRLLLPLLTSSRPARIINVSSAGQQAIDFADVMLTKGYSGRRAYCQSKLAQILSTLDLAEELKGSGVAVACLHPATFMDTAMVRSSGVSPLSTVDEGADAILHLADAVETGNPASLYFDGLRPARADAQAYEARARQRLRSLSFELVGLPAPARDARQGQ